MTTEPDRCACFQPGPHVRNTDHPVRDVHQLRASLFTDLPVHALL